MKFTLNSFKWTVSSDLSNFSCLYKDVLLICKTQSVFIFVLYQSLCSDCRQTDNKLI